jgi:hypothetical protein
VNQITKVIFIYYSILAAVGQESVVSIATGYGLGSLGIKISLQYDTLKSVKQ